MSAEAFAAAVEHRRSIYTIGKDLPCSEKEVTKLIHDITRNVPSTHNSQSCRLIILYNEDHDKFWETVKAAIRSKASAEQYAVSEAKINNYLQAGAGTILYYYDNQAVEDLQKEFPHYAKHYPSFAMQTSAMTQFAVWTALSEAKIGATLQHYNEMIEEKVREMYNVPEKWRMMAQMPFGSVKGPGHDKKIISDEGRFMVFGQSDDS